MKIVLRIVLSTLVVSTVFVLTQDIQIFPGALEGLWESKQRDITTLPESVSSYFIETEDSKILEVWRLEAKGKLSEGSEIPVAILFHGNAETVDSTYFLQDWLSELGIESYSFDYRGYGKSSGWPSDSGLKSDVKAVANFVSERVNVEEQPVILFGSSIGTGFAAYATRFLPAKVVILLAPYTSLKTLVSELPVFGFLYPFLWYDIETASYLATQRELCLIVAHGEKDNTIPVSHGKNLLKLMPESFSINPIFLHDSGHNDIFIKAKERVTKALLQCLRQLK